MGYANVQLTNNFWLKEFIEPFGGRSQKVEFEALGDVERLIVVSTLGVLASELQEHVRDVFKKPVKITSGWRYLDPRFHGKAMAADFVVPGVSNTKIQSSLWPHYKGGVGGYNNHTHIDIRHLFYNKWRDTPIKQKRWKGKSQ